MALSLQERSDILKLAALMFNAAPGATYLPELTLAFESNGRSLAALGRDLSAGGAYLALNPSTQTSAEFAAAFLTPLGLQANGDAVAFITSGLAAGKTKGQLAAEAVLALNATTSPVFADAKAIMNNKAAVAEYFSVTKAVVQANLTQLQQVLAGVTKDAATITTASTAIDSGLGASTGNTGGATGGGTKGTGTGTTGTPGTTYALTTSIDLLTGTANDDTFIGSGAPLTVSVADSITGGAGLDTLKIFGTNLMPTLSGVEVVYFNAAGGGVDVSSKADVTTLQIANDAVGYANTIGESQNVALISVTGNGTSFTTTPSDTALTVSLNGAINAGAAIALDLKGAALATLTIEATTAASNVRLNNSSSATAFKTVKVTGDAAVTIDAQTNGLTGITTVDASASTGGVTYLASNAAVKMTGGSGADTISFAAGQFTSADGFDGGAGTDTLKINDTALTSSAADAIKGANAVKNVEVLAFGTVGVALDASLITSGISTFRIDAGAGANTFTNLASGQTVEVNAVATGANDLSLGVALGNSAGALKVTASSASAATVSQLVTGGVGALGIESAFAGAGAQAAANVVVVKSNSDNTTFNLKGAQPLTFSGVKATSTGSSIDGSAATGQLTITGSSKSDVIKGGAGADTLSGNGGNDQLTGGGGADIFLFQGGDASVAGTANVVTIADFNAGVDRIGLKQGANQFLNGLNIGAATVTLSGTQTIATAADLADVYANISAIGASTDTAIQARLVSVSAGGAAGLYLYVNDDTGAVTAAQDLLIKLTGTVGTITASDFSLVA